MYWRGNFYYLSYQLIILSRFLKQYWRKVFNMLVMEGKSCIHTSIDVHSEKVMKYSTFSNHLFQLYFYFQIHCEVSACYEDQCPQSGCPAKSMPVIPGINVRSYKQYSNFISNTLLNCKKIWMKHMVFNQTKKAKEI